MLYTCPSQLLQHKMSYKTQSQSVCKFVTSQLFIITCLCLISSFFCSRKADGIPAMFSWALSNSGQRSFMNSRAFFPFKNPVKLICIIFPSGFCNTNSREEERGEETMQLILAQNQSAELWKSTYTFPSWTSNNQLLFNKSPVPVGLKCL